ncbi:ABC transporter ATP-binding protein [Noviherbaspirillum sp. UKPF54]|uniref:ABC transporter ATP-binding protein n=1 Tax=Noviherbaspirillum sp. UKPF54 TaxID=2601898 RepID=UPI0011B17B6F|nr:ABC transporter ATP-binding protein [Noviherbaspirillum sp. UKPF54]QDZ26697.1 ABC transporter ATP-binding protein [Noviherbaspirillum sp. UKPF54]
MLEISNLRAGYGAINVLWDVSLDFAEGELTTIVGPNGAGKSTLLKAIMGLVPSSQGDITLRGASLAQQRTWDMSEQGVVLVPEGRMVFRDMSVEENLTMGAFPKSRRAAAARNIERAYELFPKLKERRKQLAGSLSGGEAQMVAMARGLMAEPRLLLIDEPSLGLAPVIVHEIFHILGKLKQQGVTIVLVEQNTHMALSVADRVYMMRSGRVVLDKPASEIDVAKLHDLYFALEA